MMDIHILFFTVLVVIGDTKLLNFEICDIMELRIYIDKVDVQAGGFILEKNKSTNRQTSDLNIR